jgi:hypothetical protein
MVIHIWLVCGKTNIFLPKIYFPIHYRSGYAPLAVSPSLVGRTAGVAAPTAGAAIAMTANDDTPSTGKEPAESIDHEHRFCGRF